MKHEKKMKKGITLIEIILAIVLIAIILGIAIPKLMTNSTQAEIKQTAVSDLKSIVEAASLWRRSSAKANGNFKEVSVDEIESRLPSNMEADTTKGIIYSSGLKTGTLNGSIDETGLQYSILWDPGLSSTPPEGSFTIVVDARKGQNDLGWEGRMARYALEVFDDALMDMADNEAAVYDKDITASTGKWEEIKCSEDLIKCYHSVLIR
ncbi:MAG: prepilin-type N-terminal cleavage/methylation domain-containing protein [Arcobacter sp.]|nr:prepilin-type N-terminal cleavage/methylation domain-containing protein [Arcobacter sp.]